MPSLLRPIRSRPKLSAAVLTVLVLAVASGVFWWNGRGSPAAATPS